MVEVTLRRFRRTLSGVRRVGLDTPVLIYHMENVPPYTELTTRLLVDAAAGALEIVLSVVAVSEILVGPWRKGNTDQAGRIDAAIRAIPGVRFADITLDGAGSAAALRGRTGLPLPDALIISSSVAKGAQVILTNDKTWRAKNLPCRVILLDEYVRV